MTSSIPLWLCPHRPARAPGRIRGHRTFFEARFQALLRADPDKRRGARTGRTIDPAAPERRPIVLARPTGFRLERTPMAAHIDHSAFEPDLELGDAHGFDAGWIRALIVGEARLDRSQALDLYHRAPLHSLGRW